MTAVVPDHEQAYEKSRQPEGMKPRLMSGSRSIAGMMGGYASSTFNWHPVIAGHFRDPLLVQNDRTALYSPLGQIADARETDFL